MFCSHPKRDQRALTILVEGPFTMCQPSAAIPGGRARPISNSTAAMWPSTTNPLAHPLNGATEGPVTALRGSRTESRTWREQRCLHHVADL